MTMPTTRSPSNVPTARVHRHTMTRRELAQAFGLALFLGPLLALAVNGVNPFGAVTWVLAAVGFLTAAVTIGGGRILHTTATRRSAP